MKEVVTFFLSGKEYGVEVSRIQGIENYGEISGASEVPENFLGIACIRDEMIPVLDIKKKLVLPPVPVTGETKYVVLRTEKRKLAFVIDGVSRILQAEGDAVQDFPALVQTKSTAYGDFVVNHEGHLILAINPEGLLTAEEWQKIEEVLKSKSEEQEGK